MAPKFFMIASYVYQDRLETGRLITRFLKPEDALTWVAFLENEECVRFLSDFGITDIYSRAKYWIDRQLIRYENRRYGLQALIEKETQSFVGICGLLEQEIDGKTEIEVGYHLLRPFWGKGYATEAAKAFTDYAFHNKLASSVISIIDIHNFRSQKVAERNGFRREKQTRWSDHDVFIYRINK